LTVPVLGVIVTEPPPEPAKVRTQLRAAATYGPTNGPPLPTGAAPAGFTEPVDVSAKARARFSRPLPVCSVVPAASAVRANRPTTAPFDSDPSAARKSAAAPATYAAEADVPVTVVVPTPTASVTMSVPGAARKVSRPPRACSTPGSTRS